ncbi:unnamed protein product [Arabidopsis thaliana]|uniref:Uncharacterized protein n=1 Tax=Arabidopsis thaliana TaxID=3702 RepID=A0A5S9XI14_ARATH|nr:unnamed protein product [Arabidopsis thaliana]
MARSLTTASLRPSPSFPKDLCAFLTLRRPPVSTLSLIPPSPPDPVEPPDPLDPLLVRNFAGVVSWPLLICFVSSLSLASQISKFLDLSSIPLVASLSALSPIVGSSWGALFAFRHSLIAVCRLYSGKKIFCGEARLTFASLCDMGWWFSIVIEVPLFDGIVCRNVAFALLAKERSLKASLEAKDGARIGCLGLVVSRVELWSYYSSEKCHIHGIEKAQIPYTPVAKE